MNSYCIECQSEPLHSKLKANPYTGRSIKLTVTAWLNRVSQLSLTIMQRRTDRRALKELAELDETALQDIGLTRDDIKWASRLPLSTHASQELEKIARQPKRFQ